MDDEGRHNHEFRFNAILVGLLGIIAGAIMVATYHLIHSLCGSCRRQTVETANSSQNVHQNQQERPSERSRSRSNSITPRLISIFRYSKDCNEEMCAVCLADFKEGEQIRVLPDCLHFFHVPCIDKWLNLHSNCPLCRADASSSPQDSSRTPPLGLNRLPDFRV